MQTPMVKAYDMSLEALETTAGKMYRNHGMAEGLATVKKYIQQNEGNARAIEFWTAVQKKLQVLTYDRDKACAKAIELVDQYGEQALEKAQGVAGKISTLSGRGEQFWLNVAEAVKDLLETKPVAKATAEAKKPAKFKRVQEQPIWARNAPSQPISLPM